MGGIGLLFAENDGVSGMRNDRGLVAHRAGSIHVLLEVRIAECAFKIIIPPVDDVTARGAVSRIFIGVSITRYRDGGSVGRATQKFQVVIVGSELRRPAFDG